MTRTTNPPAPLAMLDRTGLSPLFGEAELRQWLAERGLPGLRRLRYRRWKPGTSQVLAVDLTTGPAFLACWATGGADKIAKYVRPATRRHILLADPAAGVLVAGPAADRDLRRLPEVSTGSPDALTQLSYKPMRRWVGRVDGATDSAVVRVYRRGGGTAADSRHRAVAELVPGTASVREVRDDLLVVDHLPGRPVDVCAPDDLAELGRLVAAWHRLRPAPSTPAMHLPSWRASAHLAARLAPDLAGRIRALLSAAEAGAALAAGTARSTGEGSGLPAAALCHGDLSADQVLIGPDGRAVLIDHDHAGAGDPAWDLASLLVTLPPQADRGALLAGYGLDDWPPEVAALVPAVCLGRSTEAFRACRPDWRAELERLVGLGESQADRIGTRTGSAT